MRISASIIFKWFKDYSNVRLNGGGMSEGKLSECEKGTYQDIMMR
jgi:hypothetical protein